MKKSENGNLRLVPCGFHDFYVAKRLNSRPSDIYLAPKVGSSSLSRATNLDFTVQHKVKNLPQ